MRYGRNKKRSNKTLTILKKSSRRNTSIIEVSNGNSQTEN